MAFEVKRGSRVRPAVISGLKAFLADYPMAKAYLVYTGIRRMYQDRIEIVPVMEMSEGMKDVLLGENP